MKIDIEAMMQASREAGERVGAPEADDSTEKINESPLSYEELEQKFISQWLGGAKLEAIETVLGRRIDARDIANDPNLPAVVLLQDANEAFGALLMIQRLENSTTNQDL